MTPDKLRREIEQQNQQLTGMLDRNKKILEGLGRPKRRSRLKELEDFYSRTLK